MEGPFTCKHKHKHNQVNMPCILTEKFPQPILISTGEFEAKSSKNVDALTDNGHIIVAY